MTAKDIFITSRGENVLSPSRLYFDTLQTIEKKLKSCCYSDQYSKLEVYYDNSPLKSLFQEDISFETTPKQLFQRLQDKFPDKNISLELRY